MTTITIDANAIMALTPARIAELLGDAEKLCPTTTALIARLEAGEHPSAYLAEILAVNIQFKQVTDRLNFFVDRNFAAHTDEHSRVQEGLYILADTVSGWDRLYSAIVSAGWDPDKMTCEGKIEREMTRDEIRADWVQHFEANPEQYLTDGHTVESRLAALGFN